MTRKNRVKNDKYLAFLDIFHRDFVNLVTGFIRSDNPSHFLEQNSTLYNRIYLYKMQECKT